MESEIITYQAIAHPVPLGSNQSTPKGYTKLKLTKEFFIETKSRHSWGELSQADYRYCVSIWDSTCPALSIDRDRNDLSCLAALLTHSFNGVHIAMEAFDINNLLREQFKVPDRLHYSRF